MKLAPLALLLVACGGPPQSISLDPTFTPGEVAQIQDARDAWCEQTGWCPTWAFDGELHIVRDQIDEPLPPPGTQMPAGHESSGDDDIHLDGRVLDAVPEWTWVLVAHELGHAQGFAHCGVAGDTMFWHQDAAAYELRGCLK